ncbi:MAG TPA: cytochrome c, partial [Vicinamibacterales bacterium]|nr:cytochrome c [Vicinamibacterales bacterium]
MRDVLRPAIVIPLLLVALATVPTQAHKPITSKYTYNADVFPIFRDRCGTCHGPGGAAPMSLLNYKEAVPWAESIREELIDEKMPPWYVDPSRPRIKGAKAISPKEIDTIVTWATG